MEIKKPDTVGYILIITLLSLLIYAGWLSAKSIQWGVLKNMENKTLILPPVATPSAQNQTVTSSPQPTP